MLRQNFPVDKIPAPSPRRARSETSARAKNPEILEIENQVMSRVCPVTPDLSISQHPPSIVMRSKVTMELLLEQRSNTIERGKEKERGRK